MCEDTTEKASFTLLVSLCGGSGGRSSGQWWPWCWSASLPKRTLGVCAGCPAPAESLRGWAVLFFQVPVDSQLAGRLPRQQEPGKCQSRGERKMLWAPACGGLSPLGQLEPLEIEGVLNGESQGASDHICVLEELT